ncbi:MAG: sigma-70 family RNA polymerase sigma factor [Paludisphaera borealis]|uniref:RNA polymerase sigma factor n=1 Tax=Paludisphaera borealis TaxID=1387353 RepID=UPI00284B632E|nr:sigma-70 family RNA polymerase sigma factor [Paludisphaera borealis]MDR3618726.1 sigma-70 family RNA polymerase sigma factor [Paludisphaera borealis]
MEFVEIYEPMLQRLARRNGLRGADADDLTQEVFRAVAGAIDRWDPDPARGSFRSWLFRIARNLIVNLLAARKRQSAGYGTGDTDTMALLEAQPAVEPEASALFDIEYRRRLFAWAAERVRGEVHESTWQAFWRTGVEGQDVPSVAKALGLSPGAVYVARSRVMARLRREIESVEGIE